MSLSQTCFGWIVTRCNRHGHCFSVVSVVIHRNARTRPRATHTFFNCVVIVWLFHSWTCARLMSLIQLYRWKCRQPRRHVAFECREQRFLFSRFVLFCQPFGITIATGIENRFHRDNFIVSVRLLLNRHRHIVQHKMINKRRNETKSHSRSICCWLFPSFYFLNSSKPKTFSAYIGIVWSSPN